MFITSKLKVSHGQEIKTSRKNPDRSEVLVLVRTFGFGQGLWSSEFFIYKIFNYLFIIRSNHISFIFPLLFVSIEFVSFHQNTFNIVTKKKKLSLDLNPGPCCWWISFQKKSNSIFLFKKSYLYQKNECKHFS